MFLFNSFSPRLRPRGVCIPAAKEADELPPASQNYRSCGFGDLSQGAGPRAFTRREAAGDVKSIPPHLVLRRNQGCPELIPLCFAAGRLRHLPRVDGGVYGFRLCEGPLPLTTFNRPPTRSASYNSRIWAAWLSNSRNVLGTLVSGYKTICPVLMKLTASISQQLLVGLT